MIVEVCNEYLHVTYDNVADLYYYSSIKKLNGYDKESRQLFSYDNIEPDDYTVYTDLYQTIELLEKQIKSLEVKYDHLYNCLCSEIQKRAMERPISIEKMEEVINELETSKINI